ncbi:MAG: signal peptidase II [Dermatophilaceae bacterium]
MAGVVYLLDRLTKAWAVSNLSLGEPQELLGSVLQLHLVFNPGAAFSLGAGSTWVFTIVQAAVSLAILGIAFRVRTWPWRVGLGLVLGGALGNLTDRLTREPGFGVGHVVDFLELPRWPVFNIADSAIVTGAVVVAIATVLGVPALSRTDGEDGPAQASERADV